MLFELQSGQIKRKYNRISIRFVEKYVTGRRTRFRMYKVYIYVLDQDHSESIMNYKSASLLTHILLFVLLISVGIPKNTLATPFL